MKKMLEPAVGKINPSSNPHVDVATYQPPARIAVNTNVKIIVRFHGYGQNNTATMSVQVLKP
jgi:hypothetical protein